MKLKGKSAKMDTTMYSFQKANKIEILFINKRFVLNEMFQQNASKFAIFYV